MLHLWKTHSRQCTRSFPCLELTPKAAEKRSVSTTKVERELLWKHPKPHCMYDAIRLHVPIPLVVMVPTVSNTKKVGGTHVVHQYGS